MEQDISVIDNGTKTSKRSTIQEVVFGILEGKESMEFDQLVNKAMSISPRTPGTYERVIRSEFVVNEDNGSKFVQPKISDHGYEVIAKYVASRGINHWTLQHFPKQVLAKAVELKIADKVQAVIDESHKLAEPKPVKETKPAESKVPEMKPTIKISKAQYAKNRREAIKNGTWKPQAK